MTTYNDVLKKSFKHDRFRDNQLQIIKHLLEDKKDVCVVMFTGAGKSLCYQFPPVYTNKLTIVISPLISLMNDQQMKLNSLDIPSCCLNSTYTLKEKNTIKNDILK